MAVVSSPIEHCPTLAQKAVIEYPLPGTRQTHEVVAVGDSLLLVSQQDCSSVVKVQLDSGGHPESAHRFRMGSSQYSGFHGLFTSKRYSHHGWVWGTLQFESAIVLFDPRPSDLNAAPVVIQRYPMPKGAFGPHVVIEDGDHVWTTCKGSGHLVKVTPFLSNGIPQGAHTAKAYECHGRPIFVGVHPTSKEVYASLDLDNKIFRLHAKTSLCDDQPERSSLIDIPPEKGSSPVGLVAGTDGNIWFSLAGDSSGGTSTFGRISGMGEITWFKLPVSPLNRNIGLLHIAFDPYVDNGNFNNTVPLDSASITGERSVLKFWLLGTTLLSTNSFDAIFTISIEGDRIVRQDTIALATQPCFTHRVLPHRDGVFVTELGVSVLAYASGYGIGIGDRRTVGESYETPSETSDKYALWGLGRYSDQLIYSTMPYASELSLSSKKRKI